MERRKFLTRAGAAGGLAATMAGPAVAQGTRPEIRWRIASSYPKTLDTIYGAMHMVTQRVAELTDNRFKISLHAAGELVPPLQVLDAVQNGTVGPATAPAISTSARTRPSASAPRCRSA